VGKVVVKTKIWNFVDEVMAQKGLIRPKEIRSVEVEGLVDSGATVLTLPEELVEQLGLMRGGEVEVTYADGRRGKRPTAFGVKIEILGRQAESHVLVEKQGTKVLIGQTILEALDLIIDPKKGMVIPRPGHEDMPLIELLRSQWRRCKV